ncbi:hypothetical protein A2422_03140 [Candidatus Woesebacteria bacterium RIFOXYC1_FULL_31_51]|uniref:Uncharacterized protein n=1 Tax=Candidatus Woesebacteria bacterium GW2011_GWC2_31_9 TaxID=1618586 RepID=A0A0G0BM99_9BACT|nr:MAG: hypothetical protein UR17_C0001G0134 [Candidatus Woesebacteria bacterium GW2011_GWF1_31_35]KKP23371.1 MAG: hypothetical protein UR11_C0001G0345 [Candidatus Woesebacteria bacterium GW2011_GWC1_30_29]KKP25225.1 MAG: hypothetical protein UR13_C0010G0027 [Candidatus Woesebacteria bacterium GW2011_GWD1_31_12]KKP27630.1 MAG: hypothetical protein UR16_C0003G0290 [Candidatus Woesebacteria bacterium GW2011_GWB1_31_29]KKP32147.1 MAG: hypothetical protein UR21_C0002G0066 [Candidatus Woesebacteria 
MDNEQKLKAESYMFELQKKIANPGQKIDLTLWSIVEDRDGKIWIKKESPDGINGTMYPVLLTRG